MQADRPPVPWRHGVLFAYDEVDSTNNVLCAMAKRDAAHGTIVLAHRQSAGRGLGAHSFFSPLGGLYFSVCVCDPPVWKITPPLTLYAAVAVRRVLRRHGVETHIKWVNDIYVGTRKVCGILTQAGADNSGSLFAVVGIGLNLYPATAPPPEIADRIGYLAKNQSKFPTRETLAIEISTCLFSCFYEDSEKIRAEYKAHNLLMGKKIRYVVNEETRTGLAADIDHEGRLVITQSGAVSDVLASGQIRLLEF